MMYRTEDGIIPPYLKKMPSQKELKAKYKRDHRDDWKRCAHTHSSWTMNYAIEYVDGEYVLVPMKEIFNKIFCSPKVVKPETTHTSVSCDEYDSTDTPKEFEGDTPEEGLKQTGLKTYIEKLKSHLTK